ncbi:GNAT family N-acetyltransferase [Bombilactobacillus thymidiniphilus]|uniref:GNAT family N-acetyltransferase n=1 Tax=Bombilactobacillus thymidiniphilus TaxID=2923363 RepID=A0ABY4PF96_9LACO|nr:GNAT family N-acetyltransferase [Bombilactobacillus thymidiniphilus]UQS84211.1 GNAT family N-acetyltransferase [Bombilactobacillus thymidiniphilus]
MAELSIYLDQNYQHQGIGQQALNFVISQLVSLKIETLLTFIFSNNQASIKLFQKNNFELWEHLTAVAQMVPTDPKLDLEIWGRHF